MKFFNFNNYTNRIIELLHRFPTFLVYGKNMIGKTTYIKEALSEMGYYISNKTGKDYFGNVRYKVVRIETLPKRMEKNTIYESLKQIDGFVSLKIDYPTKDSKLSFLSECYPVSEEVKNYILKNKLNPFQIIKLSHTNYIEEEFVDNSKDSKIPYSPNNRVKFLIENLMLKRGNLKLFNKICIFDLMRYNRNISKYFFEFFTLKNLRGNKYGKRKNKKINNRKI